MMSHFSQTSYFDNTTHAFRNAGTLASTDTPRLEPKLAAKGRTITNKQLEDWSYRIEQCAHEAEDERLLALNSDLLDLRDEIVYLLHQNV